MNDPITQNDVHVILNQRLDRFSAKVLERIDERMAHHAALAEMREESTWMGRNLYLPLATGLMGVVIAGGAFYLSEYHKFVPKAEFAKFSPYIEDRSLILKYMSEDAARGESRDRQIKEFSMLVTQLAAQLSETRAVLIGRLERIEKKLKEG